MSNLKIALISRLPPARCGIAEYTSMLAEALLRNLDYSEIALVGTRVKEGLRHYVEPYSGLEVCQSFSEDGGYGEIIECLKEKGLRRGSVAHIQHDYDIFRDNAEFMSLVRKLKEMGVRVVITMHTVAHALKSPEYVVFQRKLSEVVDAVIVHSRLQEFELIAQGADPRKIVVIPHGTHLNPFTKYDKVRLLEGLGVDSPEDLAESTLITVPGLIRPVKGLEVFINVFKHIRSKYDVRFLLIGSPQGQGYEYLRKLAPILSKLEGAVFMNKFLWRNELLAYLASIDIAVFPYRDTHHYAVSGIFHLVIGSRKPPICTRIPKFIECYEVAPELTAPTNAPSDIAEKVEYVINNPKGVSEAVSKLWDYAVETSWENVALKHCEVYAELTSP